MSPFIYSTTSFAIYHVSSGFSQFIEATAPQEELRLARVIWKRVIIGHVDMYQTVILRKIISNSPECCDIRRRLLNHFQIIKLLIE